MCISQVEMQYPESFARKVSPELCRRLGLDIQEVVGLSMRINRLTGRPKLQFTFH